MWTKRILILILLLAGISCFTACVNREQLESTSQVEIAQEESLQDAHTQEESPAPSVEKPLGFESTVSTGESVTEGVETYRGFVLDNILHSENEGDIHYNLYVPKGYDGSVPYALFVTLPGYEGLYFQGVGANLRAEEYGFEAQKYNAEMIVAAPQLNDWGETSADQTIALTEYLLSRNNIDLDKIYLHGLSGGGETGSLVMGKRPELYAAYLATATQWDGDLEVLAQARTPVYLAVGENDSYYGSGPLKYAYATLYSLYEEQGLSPDEIDELVVLDVKGQDYFSQRGYFDQHAGGLAFAFDEEIVGWFFSK